MPVSRAEKEKIVEELHERFSRAAVVVATRFTGLNVAALTELRKKIREAGAEYRVVKNTLLRRAVEGTPVAGMSEEFTGPNAVAIGYDDPVAVAKVLADFAKDHPELEVKGGMLAGARIDAAGVQALAKLPSREVLLAQLLSVMVAVPTGLVQVLAAVPRKLLYALRALEEQKKAA
ncbi:50S ribosomal protein L10 [Dissulfurirhabdus thermomarina]|uniref:Large ribosomal subunit protein uL10 n=1 Tax=Dissulfurirhabdus thermomarina TaxID=1765737 RepID=A0A6N9TPF8_DISTH|nr:50S ribosomal protein L10 [Dissulfurirhabdus thermomarina]NDY42330.1 50S ribosomal protein L10 [Dissulfurirhabdus thermomarina]NMX23397.1 50S ribosomal protein L10 [Dissulfurirhabdus thermomarina]